MIYVPYFIVGPGRTGTDSFTIMLRCISAASVPLTSNQSAISCETRQCACVHAAHVSSHTQMFHHTSSSTSVLKFQNFVWTNKTPMTFISNYCLSMAVFAWIELNLLCIISKSNGEEKVSFWGKMHLCHLLFQNINS